MFIHATVIHVNKKAQPVNPHARRVDAIVIYPIYGQRDPRTNANGSFKKTLRSPGLLAVTEISIYLVKY